LGSPVAFTPGWKYPSVSITGSACWLMCSYCRGRFLKGMVHVSSPSELAEFAGAHAARGGLGVLVSGGFTREGRLPVEPYIPVLKNIRERYGLIVSVHPGFIPVETMDALKRAGVDVVDYELVLDDYVLKYMKNLSLTSRDVVEHYWEMLERGPRYVVPHIPLAFTGSDEWVEKAIEFLRDVEAEITVFLVNVYSTPSVVNRVLRVLEKARSKLPGEISLGCMRPHRIKSVIDKVVVEQGLVDRIANPSRHVLEHYGLKLVETCCSIPRSILANRSLI